MAACLMFLWVCVAKEGLARRGSKCLCVLLGPPRAIKGSRHSNQFVIGLKWASGVVYV